MKIIKHDSLEHFSIPGIDHITLAGNSDGLQHLSIWRQVLGPNTATPPHRHNCEEVVICEVGHGEIHVDGKVHAFGSDMSIVIPPNVVHQIFNVGSDEMKLTAGLSASPVVVTLPDDTPLPLPWRT